MSSDHVDPEELAALLDGTLTEAERERVLATLARSEESYRDLLESVALLNAMEPVQQPSDTRAPAQPQSSVRTVFPQSAARWRSPRVFVPATVLAAALVIAVVMRSRPEKSSSDLLAVIALAGPGTSTGNAATAFGVGWNEPRWAESRGRNADDSVDKSLFRAGARFAELELAIAMHDSTAASTIASMLAASIAGVDGGALVAPTIDRVVASGGQDRGTLLDQLRALGPSPVWFDLGAWSEAARLASTGGRLAFFAADGEPIAQLRRILADGERLDAESWRALEAVVAALRPLAERQETATTDLGVVRTLVDSALAVGAR